MHLTARLHRPKKRTEFPKKAASDPKQQNGERHSRQFHSPAHCIIYEKLQDFPHIGLHTE